MENSSSFNVLLIPIIILLVASLVFSLIIPITLPALTQISTYKEHSRHFKSVDATITLCAVHFYYTQPDAYLTNKEDRRSGRGPTRVLRFSPVLTARYSVDNKEYVTESSRNIVFTTCKEAVDYLQQHFPETPIAFKNYARIIDAPGSWERELLDEALLFLHDLPKNRMIRTSTPTTIRYSPTNPAITSLNEPVQSKPSRSYIVTILIFAILSLALFTGALFLCYRSHYSSRTIVIISTLFLCADLLISYAIYSNKSNTISRIPQPRFSITIDHATRTDAIHSHLSSSAQQQLTKE